MNSWLDTSDRYRPPAGAWLGPRMRAWLARVGRTVWRALEAHGRARARGELHALADRYEITQPELATKLRAASLYDARR